jgi:hypothetical protein
MKAVLSTAYVNSSVPSLMLFLLTNISLETSRNNGYSLV